MLTVFNPNKASHRALNAILMKEIQKCGDYQLATDIVDEAITKLHPVKASMWSRFDLLVKGGSIANAEQTVCNAIKQIKGPSLI